MAKQVIPQYAFNNGEVGTKIYARADFDKYSKSMRTATNCFVVPHGPVIRRSGFRFVEEVKDSTENARLIPFIFDNSGDAILIVLNKGVFRFFKDGAVLGGPLEVSHPYTETQLDDVDYVQFGDILYLTHGSHPPATLTRTSDLSWVYEATSFSPWPGTEGDEHPNFTLTPGATTGIGVTFTTSGAYFKDADVGRQLINLVDTGAASITSITSSTVAVCDVVQDFPNTSAIASGDWNIDLSPVSTISVDRSSVGSIALVVSRPSTIPEVTNGDFTNSASGWLNISAGTGTGGWDSNTRSLQLTGAGVGNEGIMEQPISSRWVGNFTLKFNNDTTATVRVGTSSGASDILSTVKTAAIGNEVTFSRNNEDETLHISFSSTVTTLIDMVEITATVDTFRSDDVDKLIKVNGGAILVTSVINDWTAQGEIKKTLNSTEDSFNWRIEKEEWTDERGYPRYVEIYQNRLVYASTVSKPVSFWMSETSIFNGFGEGPDDEDSIQESVSAPLITWLSSSRDLLVGTSNSEMAILGGESGSAVTPSNIRPVVKTYYGSDGQTPLRIGTEILFVQGGGKKLRSMGYEFASDGYNGEDLLFLSDHLPTSIKEGDYAYNPDSIIYLVDDSGKLLIGSYVREQSVIGWTKYTTEGSFENIAVIPNNGVDDIYVIANRTINGTTKRYVEKLRIEDDTELLSGISDSYLTYDAGMDVDAITNADPGVVTSPSHGLSDGDTVKIIGATGMTEVNTVTYTVANKTTHTFELNDAYANNVDTTAFGTYTTSTGKAKLHKLVDVISGLGHLEGETIQLKVDGAKHPDKVVTSGSVTLDYDAYNVVAGLSYTTVVETMNPQFAGSIGVMQGQPQRNVRVILRMYDSTLPMMDDTDFIPARTGLDLMDNALPLFSGDIEYNSSNWGRTGRIKLTIDEPLPFKLQGIFAVIEGNNR